MEKEAIITVNCVASMAFIKRTPDTPIDTREICARATTTTAKKHELSEKTDTQKKKEEKIKKN